MKYCQELDRACLQRLTKRALETPKKKPPPKRRLERDGKSKVLVHLQLHWDIPRGSRSGGTCDGDGVDSSRRTAADIRAGARRSAARLQHDRAGDQAENKPGQPSASLAACTQSQADQAESCHRKPCGVERSAMSQAAGGHWTGHGRDAQGRG